MKNFLLAVLIAVVLINCFGIAINDWWGVNIVMHDDLLSPLEGFAVLSALAAVAVLVGFIVAIWLFGLFFLAVGAAVVALIVAGVSIFWPVLLIGGVVYMILQRRKPYAS